jgi:hypothetical protein
VAPGKLGGGGAYPSGGMAGTRRRSFGATAFVDGERSPVVVGVGDEVLQLGRGEGWGNCKKLWGLEARGGAHRGGVDGGGARPESARRRGGLGWPEAVVRAREAVGTVGRSRGGVGEEWRWENVWDRERGASGSVATRQRGKREGKVGGPGVGCHAARGRRGAWPRPASGARQWPECGAGG